MASVKRVEALKLFCTSGRRGKQKMQGQKWKDCRVLIKAKADVKVTNNFIRNKIDYWILQAHCLSDQL